MPNDKKDKRSHFDPRKIFRDLQERIEEERDVTQTVMGSENTRALLRDLDAAERGERPKERKKR